MYTKEITTEHNHLVQGIQEDFKQNDGENPNHTSSPSDAQRNYCAKLDCGVDAVAKENIIPAPIFDKKIIEKNPVLVELYNDAVMYARKGLL